MPNSDAADGGITVVEGSMKRLVLEQWRSEIREIEKLRPVD